MKRKHIAIPLLLALAANLSTFAKPNSEPASHPYNLPTFTDPDSERASHYIRYNLRTLSSAALEPDTMSAPPTLLPQPASVYDAATAAKTDITYTPYPSAKNIPANNGHRKILGETADGRLVLQDYYPKSDRPRTARALTPPLSAGTTSNNSCGTTTTSTRLPAKEPPPTCPSQPV